MSENEVLERETHSQLPAISEEGGLAAITRGEMAIWMDRAARNPRQITAFIREATAMATLNADVSKSCVYALPRDGKLINGPSVRFAEIVLSAWRNGQAAARVVDEGLEFVTAQGVFQDLERLTRVTFEVKRRITTKEGKRYNADMIGTTGNAACSIALRNAILKGVPKAFWNPIYEAARKVIAGNAITMETRRAQAIELLNKAGVTTERILARLGIKGQSDIGMDEIVTLSAAYDQIREGHENIDDLFPPIQAASGADKQTTSDKVREGLKGGGGKSSKKSGDNKGQATGSTEQQPKGEQQQPKMTAAECVAAMKAGKDMAEVNAIYNRFAKDAPDGVLPDDVVDMQRERADYFRSVAAQQAKP